MRKLNLKISFDWACFIIGVLMILVGLKAENPYNGLVAGVLFIGISLGYGIKEEVSRLQKVYNSFLCNKPNMRR